MKVAIITDTHFGARNDSQNFARYFEKFYSEQFFPYLEEQGITTILHLGDIFERRKYINFQSFFAARRYFFEPARKYDVHLIVGNHDVALKNTNEINSPDLLLRDYPNINVYSSPLDIELGDHTLAMLPWVCSDNFQESMQFLKDAKGRLLFGHLEILGFEMHAGQPSHTGFNADTFNSFEQVYSGHFHHKSERGNIAYLGSPYEITWGDYNDDRGFHVLDLDTRELEFIRNPHRMFHKIVYDDSRQVTEDYFKYEDFSQFEGCFVKLIVESKQNEPLFQRFVDKIEANKPADLIFEDRTIDRTIQDDPEMEGVDDIRAIIKSMAHSFPRDQIRTPLEGLLLNLHNEAVSQTTTK